MSSVDVGVSHGESISSDPLGVRKVITDSTARVSRSVSSPGVFPSFSSFRHEGYEELVRSEQILREAFRSSGTCVFVWNLEDRNIVLDMHELFELGKEDPHMVSQSEWLDMVHPDDREGHKAIVRAFIQNAQEVPFFNSDYRVRVGSEKDVGSEKYVWINTRGKISKDTNGKDVVIGRHTDITYRKEMEAQVSYQARHDSLTGLLNRQAFISETEQFLGNHSQSPGEKRSAMFFIDLDGFKRFNDTYGHPAGNTLLSSIGEKLRLLLREGDIIGRLGGDEFGVFLPSVTPLEAKRVGEKIIKMIQEPHGSESTGVTGYKVDGCSIGISFFPENGPTVDGLIGGADAAMYIAKKRPIGGEKVQLFDESIKKSLEESTELMTELSAALEKEGELYPVFQPIIDRTGKITSLESLIRWKHPKKGNIPPNVFIPLAEKAGLIGKVGSKMISMVIDQMNLWRENGFDYPSVAINVSPAQFSERGFKDMVEKKILGILPEKITLEITESLLMESMDQVRGILEEFRKMGVRISIDDFGTGYSSLAYLPRLPIDFLKIDRSFVNEMTTDRNQRRVCSATIGLAHDLGFTVVAEGVETKEQLDMLIAMGCDRIQGYLVSKPITGEEIQNKSGHIERRVNISQMARVLGSGSFLVKTAKRMLRGTKRRV